MIKGIRSFIFFDDFNFSTVTCNRSIIYGVIYFKCFIYVICSYFTLQIFTEGILNVAT
jgi:hypothetical protein